MQVVEFVKLSCDFELTEYEKSCVSIFYENIKKHKHFIYIPPQRGAHMRLNVIQALVIIFVGIENDVIDKEFLQEALK